MWDSNPDATVNGPVSNLDGKKWGILMLQLMDQFRIWVVQNGCVDSEATVIGPVLNVKDKKLGV